MTASLSPASMANIQVKLQFLMSLRSPSLALSSVPVLARWLGIFGVATVNRKFWPIFQLGLSAFMTARRFPSSAAQSALFQHWPACTNP